MKKLIALLLALSVLTLCAACSGDSETPTDPSTNTESTTPSDSPTDSSDSATEAPSNPINPYTNPLTGEAVETPIATRPFAVSLSNITAALPHRGVADADIFFESFVNNSIVRGLAVYADITGVESIGSTRSNRPILTDICSHYKAFFAHAGGSNYANSILAQSGVPNMNIDTIGDTGYSYRDKDRNKVSSWEHCLFVRGAELADHVINKKGIDMSRDVNTGYGLVFAEDGTPAGGETANTVDITIKYNKNSKKTTMVYNQELGKYEYHQYGMTMRDADTNEIECFENVIVMYTEMSYYADYHFANFVAGGTGYYACGGKIIPITWKCAGEDQPFTYYTQDGKPLTMGIGSSYIAITVDGAAVSYE